MSTAYKSESETIASKLCHSFTLFNQWALFVHLEEEIRENNLPGALQGLLCACRTVPRWILNEVTHVRLPRRSFLDKSFFTGGATISPLPTRTREYGQTTLSIRQFGQRNQPRRQRRHVEPGRSLLALSH